jgi:hypothetical protein
LETLGVSFRGVGSLACSKFSPVPGPCRKSRVEVDRGRVADRAAKNAAPRSLPRAEGTTEAMMAASGSLLGQFRG